MFTFLTAMAAALTPAPASMLSAPEPIVIGQSYTIRSVAMRDERRVNVLLPDGYEKPEQSGRRYPTLYILDGGTGEQDFAHLATMAQHASRWGSGVAPMIIIGVESRDRQAEFTMPSADPAERRDFPTSGRSQTFRRYLVDEVKPAIAATFRTNGHDLIMGESLAGLFVVDEALRHAGDFDAHVAISPSLWWDEQRLSKEAVSLLEKRMTSDDQLWLAMANEDGAMRAGFDRLQAALRKVGGKKLHWKGVLFANRTHATILHPAATQALLDLSQMRFCRPELAESGPPACE